MSALSYQYPHSCATQLLQAGIHFVFLTHVHIFLKWLWNEYNKSHEAFLQQCMQIFNSLCIFVHYTIGINGV